MSKTIDLQIEKSRVFIEGLSRNIEALRDKGIASDALENMSADVPGFKGWLDKNMEFHLPGTVITPVANT